MKILVVEDETKTGTYLRQGLVEAGFVVDLVTNGFDGLHLATSETYDLAILDVMLPGVDGWQILQGIRRAGNDMPVLFLTARDQVEDRVKGLELGADDYLVKPFAFAELLTRPVGEEVSHPYVWRTARNTPMRGISARAPTGIDGAAPVVIGVATDISHHEQYMAGFRVTLWSFVAFAALLTGVLGWLAARRGLAPLKAMRQKAESITAQRLHARLAADAVPAELADLATTLNDMLARLEESFRRLSDFSSDLAHEFRTPISNLMTQTQVMLSRPRTPDEYREVLGSNIEEYERLSRMVADMLFIAKADEGQIVPTRERLELEPLVGDLVEFHRLVAEEKGVAIAGEGEGMILGDPLMVRRAIGNLLSNAIRHTPTGGRVSVSVRPSAEDQVEIDVANTGETSPPEHLPRLFDRFYRADPSRAGDGSHSGLGLAIVKSIVEAHGGNISVASAGGTTCFALRFPAA